MLPAKAPLWINKTPFTLTTRLKQLTIKVDRPKLAE